MDFPHGARSPLPQHRENLELGIGRSWRIGPGHLRRSDYEDLRMSSRQAHADYYGDGREAHWDGGTRVPKPVSGTLCPACPAAIPHTFFWQAQTFDLASVLALLAGAREIRIRWELLTGASVW